MDVEEAEEAASRVDSSARFPRADPLDEDGAEEEAAGGVRGVRTAKARVPGSVILGAVVGS